MSLARSLAAITMALVATGCRVTEVIVLVDTDLPLDRIDRIEIDVVGTDGARRTATSRRQNGGLVDLPVTLGLRARSDPSGSIDLTIRALGNDATLVERRVRTTFESGESRMVRVSLRAACESVQCTTAGESCNDEGRCGPIEVGTEPWNERPDRFIDAGHDALDGAMMDAGEDAVADAAVDAADDGAPIETAPVDQVSAGAGHVCARRTSGTVSCWGRNDTGQLGRGTVSPFESVPDLVRTASGTVLMDVVAIAAGGRHTCARLNNGAIRCWGENNYLQLGATAGAMAYEPLATDPVMFESARALAGGLDHNCVIGTSGRMACWGRNQYAQLGIGRTSQSEAVPMYLPALQDVESLAAGIGHGCALSGSTVWCWGYNQFGQTGSTTLTTAQSTPMRVTFPTDFTVRALFAGPNISCATSTSGTARCWGRNAFGQIGSGETDAHYPTPRAVADVTQAVDIALGSLHGCVLENARVRCWGGNSHGQLGDGTTTMRRTATAARLAVDTVDVTAGVEYTCAATNAMGVWCWGSNATGILGTDPTSLPTSSMPTRINGL